MDRGRLDPLSLRARQFCGHEAGVTHRSREGSGAGHPRNRIVYPVRDIPQTPLVSVSDLRKQGLSRDDVATRLHGWKRVRRGIFAATWPDDREEQHLLTARAALVNHSPDTVLSHSTAALVWGYPVMLADLGPVTASTIGDGSSPDRRHPGIHLYGSALDGRDVIRHQGLLITAAVRTVLDCARTLPRRPAVAVADAAAHRNHLPEAEVLRVLSQMRGWKGVGRSREVLKVLDPGCESPGETFTRLLLQDLGYRVQSQFEVHDGGSLAGRADFRIVGEMVLVEFDGRHKYGLAPDSAPDALWREKRRHDALVQAGFEVVRLTWADLADSQLVKRMIDSGRTRSALRHGWLRPRCGDEVENWG